MKITTLLRCKTTVLVVFFFFAFSEKNVVEELVGLGHRSIDPFRISDRLVLIVLLNTNRDGLPVVIVAELAWARLNSHASSKVDIWTG